MADHAYQIQYRQEYIQTYELRQTLLRATTTTEAVIKGNQATFLVAGSGNATPTTRGLNGLIPARSDSMDQLTATLVEWHDLVRKTEFNIFSSQGNQREMMQIESMGVMNRKIDQDIITELNTATQDTGAAQQGSLFLIAYAKTILGNNKVKFDRNLTALITPAMHGYLMQVKEFASADYTRDTPFNADDYEMFRWYGLNFIVHPELPGAGTNAEKCFVYHKSAIGHAANIAGMDQEVGYMAEQKYSFARTSFDMGAKLLQNSGVVVINHDGSAMAAQ